MGVLTGKRAWLQAASALGFSLALTWGLWRFGAVETSSLQWLFLVLLVPIGLTAATAAGDRRAGTTPQLICGVAGVVLLVQVALEPALQGRGYLHLAVGWMALWLTYELASSSFRLRRFLLVSLLLLGAVEALYGLAQAIGGIDFIGTHLRNQGRTATGTLINRNHFAALLNMSLPLAIGVLYAQLASRQSARKPISESWARTWLVILGCSLMGLAVLLSRSRAGAISLLGTLLFLALLLTLGRRAGSKGLSAGTAWILLLVILVLGFGAGMEALLERFGRLGEDLPRLSVYGDTLQLIADHPWLGIGPGMYVWRFRPYQSADPRLLFDHAHNDYLESAAEWGIPLALVAWGLVLWRLFRSAAVFLESRHPERQGLALGSAAALLSIVLHSWVDFSLQIPALLMWFGAIVGLAWTLEQEPEGAAVASAEVETGRRATTRLIVQVLLLVALLPAGWRVARRAAAAEAGSPEYGVAGLESAIRWDPSGPDQRYLLGLARRDLPEAADLNAAIGHLEAACRLNPYSWRYRMELARAYELAGRTEEATLSLTEAVRLNPRSGVYRWRLGNFLLREGKMDPALTEIGKAVALDRGLLDPALLLVLKSGVDYSRIDAIWPSDRTARLRLLQRLVARNSPAPTPPPASFLSDQWQRLLDDAAVLTLEDGRFFVQYLLGSDDLESARQRWQELTSRNGLRDPDFTNGRNLVWNGDFELPLAGPPLGWRVQPAEAYAVALAQGEGAAGGAALAVEFLGRENLEFAGVAQQVILQAERAYRLSFRLRSRELTTEEGVFLEVVSRRGGRRLIASAPLTGTSGWIDQSVVFTAPEGTELIDLRLRRRPSRQIDSQLRGEIWLDSVVLEPAPEGGNDLPRRIAAPDLEGNAGAG